MGIPLENCNTATTQRNLEKKLKISSNLLVDRNGNVVPLQTYSGGENRAQRPMHKFSSADENFSQLSIFNYQLTT